ncbi:uncharacterized protein LOC111319090, partial [Stylophora pistillata]|uniref:uncharacterized protein LOC111319090 n=1 Tax=Stylophora pistillata TaxID=50429 RepID=UPI000C04A636
YNVWALCPSGYFMNGLRLGYAPPAFLNNIDEAKCCHPQNHPSSYEDCYDEDVTISFDRKGWSECQRDGFYMTGFYKSSCDKLYCIEKFRCCKMKNESLLSIFATSRGQRCCYSLSITINVVFKFSKFTVQNCEEADWEASLDQIGWSMCPRNTTFLRGLWRHDPMPGDNRVGRIEFGNCCRAEEPTFINQSSTCLNADWSLLLNRYNVWALCPSGYFMNGLRLDHALPAFLNNIAEAKCCHPQNHPSSFEDCYDEDVTTSFDTSGWSECQQDGFYMTGFYKSRCDKLYCIEKFRCCKMKSEPSPTTQNVKGTSISSSSISVTGNEVENSGKTEPPREKDERTSGVLFQFTWASFGAFVVLVCVVLIEIAMKRIRRKRKDSLVEERNDAYNVFMLEITPEIMNQLRDHSEGNPIETQVEVPNSWADEVAVVDNETYLDQMEIDRNWEIPRERLEILETELGGGEFGVVKKGNYLRGDANKLPVAVKMLKGDKDQKQRMVLIQELEMLRKVGRHKNIVSLVGACSFEEPLCVIIEFVPGGSLDQMLLESRIPARTEDANYANLWSRLSERNLLRIANDVANGMQHLESKLCVHRDLAARNILIGEGLVAKVADFGLSRDISEDGEYIKCTEFSREVTLLKTVKL